MFYQTLLKPLFFQLEEEEAHEKAVRVAQTANDSVLLRNIINGLYNYQSPLLEQIIWGKKFRNPIGLAAGFDKNGHLIAAIQALGMGFTETGSITARSSSGNPKPRVFRLPKDRALINRMGLNNDGAQVVTNRLRQSSSSIPIGVNIAKTHRKDITGDRAIRDYMFSYNNAGEVADYITINISCPNTSDGRTFQEPRVLDELLSGIESVSCSPPPPALVKFSSDLSRQELEKCVQICEEHRIDGYVACNTSAGRDALATSHSKLESIGEGGLSGAPLFFKSLERVRWLREMLGTEKPIIGVGGIDSYEKALKMLQAGATLLQVFTGLIYEGPGLVKNINHDLAAMIKRQGLSSIQDITGSLK